MSRYPLAPRPLNDGLVGLVLPRAPSGRHHSDDVEMAVPFQVAVAPYRADPGTAASPRDEIRATGDATNALLALTGDRLQPFLCDEAMKAPMLQVSSNVTPSSSAKTMDMHKRKRFDDIKSRRREQCRANQARYRDKQRNAQVQLEKNVGQLHQEVNNLKRRYRDLSSRERSSQSPWSIVAEVFHLLENCFRSPWQMTSPKEMMNHPQTRLILAVLERAFAHDVAMGDLRGVDALMEQLRLHSQCFGDPQLQLKRIESVSAGVMAALVELSVTVTELTLKHIFPNLDGKHGGANGGGLYERFLDQRLKCHGSMTFLFDENSERVVRLETKIDLLGPLLRVVGNLKDAVNVLDKARISSEYVIGDLTD